LPLEPGQGERDSAITAEVGKKMLHLASSDVQVFQVALYNERVRALVSQRRRDGRFSNRWAEVQLRDVVARDEEEARLLIAERFPPEDGFVVQEVARCGSWPPVRCNQEAPCEVSGDAVLRHAGSFQSDPGGRMSPPSRMDANRAGSSSARR
jgi:hypothetical protein